PDTQFRETNHVAHLRTDRQGPPDRPQREPRQQQDQAGLPAEPAERDAAFREAGSQPQVPRVDAWLALGRAQRWARQLAAQDFGREAQPDRPQGEARAEEGERGRLNGDISANQKSAWARPARFFIWRASVA